MIQRKVPFFILLFTFFIISCGEKKEASEKETEQKTTGAVEGQKTLVFFGNSITAGYGLGQAQAFPALIQEKLDSLGYNYKVVNAGLSGETSAGGKNRVSWILRQPVDIFVLELGGNDGLRGIDLTDTKNNLQAIIDSVGTKYPEAKILLAGMEVPPNMGPEYSSEFRQVFRELAEENDVEFLPFILEGVGGEPELNQPDQIHPTAEGHEIVTEHVWGKLGGMVEK